MHEANVTREVADPSPADGSSSLPLAAPRRQLRKRKIEKKSETERKIWSETREQRKGEGGWGNAKYLPMVPSNLAGKQWGHYLEGMSCENTLRPRISTEAGRNRQVPPFWAGAGRRRLDLQPQSEHGRGWGERRGGASLSYSIGFWWNSNLFHLFLLMRNY